MDEENSVTAMVNNPEGVIDGDSVSNNRNSHNMAKDDWADEREDGEIWSPVAAKSSPEKEAGQSHEQPVEVETLNNDEGLHGDYGDSHGVYVTPRESTKRYEGYVGRAADNDTGPNMVEEREIQSRNMSNPDGPTPLVGLGKRNRDTRSPPSSGSMQGPPNRVFFQDPPADPLFDLNRPSNSEDPRLQEEAVLYQNIPVTADPNPQP
ncbi:hypothetical protein Hanom_Chr01g00079551 [Helianthus anomalus]